MAVSDVSICNLALQKLGAARIVSLSDDSRNARSCNAAYEQMRDRELRAYRWNFNKAWSGDLAADATAPTHPDYGYAFPVPTDFLNLRLPADNTLDWILARHGGRRAVLTNDSGPINVPYGCRITDPTEFDPLFVDALACKLAWHMAEEITQSNQKKADAANEYKMAIAEARRANSFEVLPAAPDDDSWLSARL
jgi:hypothetical protein